MIKNFLYTSLLLALVACGGSEPTEEVETVPEPTLEEQISALEKKQEDGTITTEEQNELDSLAMIQYKLELKDAILNKVEEEGE